MDCALEALRGLSVAPTRIHVERFVSLPDEEDASHAIDLGATENIQLVVELDGVHHELSCSRAEPILDAMLRAGLRAPHSCQSGACGSCMCTLEAGDIHLRHNQVLDKTDLKQGWILACQAIADSALIRVRFPDSLGDNQPTRSPSLSRVRLVPSAVCIRWTVRKKGKN